MSELKPTFYHLKCFRCGRVHEESESVTSCVACGGPLETYYDYSRIDERLNIHSLKTAPISAMKYVAFYPINNFKNLFSLQEGGTPLIQAKQLGEKIGLPKLYIKNEGANPTGVFKDRGTLVEITKAMELGATAVCLASTGNMAASVATYCSVVGLPCYVLVPEGTPIGKLAQTLSAGAKVIQVRGTYSDCAVLAAELAERFDYYLAGDYTFRTEGQKSQAYEIIEQLFWRSPDYLVAPVGCGTNLHAIAKGFKEFKQLGLIDRLPKLIAVQSPGCDPVVRAFEQGRKDFDPVTQVNTIASAVAAGNPLDGEKVLADLYEFEGFAVEIDDDELIDAQLEQYRVGGVFSEPSGALPYAAVRLLRRENRLPAEATVVCVATGHGLKDPRTPLSAIAEPPSVDPDIEEIAHLIEHKLYAIRESGRRQRGRILLNEAPATSDKMQKLLEKEFELEVSMDLAEAVLSNVQQFVAKGKQVSKGDLQMILEEVLDEIAMRERTLEVKDFRITTSLSEQAHAALDIRLLEHESTVEADGVGPVDAAIKALQQGITELNYPIELTDYQVQIDDQGVDATVEVKMTVQDSDGNKVVAQTTSPDIIVASIKAFEKGFNLLRAKRGGEA